MNVITKIIWKVSRNIATSLIDDIDKLLEFIGINRIFSFINSLPDNLINNTQFSDTSILHNRYTIPVPIHQNLDQTPTVTQFLNIANSEYTITGHPKETTPFLIHNKQVAIQDATTGMAAKVWKTNKNQLVISFQGTTGGDNLFLNPFLTISQLATDVQTNNQAVSQAEKKALQFTQYVVNEAEKQGYYTNDIFVTGHSLGGVEASYVAQQTGLAGMAFEAKGIPSSEIGHGQGNNFVSIVTYGDPMGEYASDTLPDSPLVTSMNPGEKHQFNHYGKLVMLGDVKDEIKIKNKLADWNSNSLNNIFDLINVFPDFIKYHLPNTQAADMGIKLSPHSILADTITTQHGPIVPIGNDTISQIMHYIPVNQNLS